MATQKIEAIPNVKSLNSVRRFEELRNWLRAPYDHITSKPSQVVTSLLINYFTEKKKKSP